MLILYSSPIFPSALCCVEAHYNLDCTFCTPLLILFGHYLKEGLYFDDIVSENDAPNLMQLSGYASQFDAYYLALDNMDQEIDASGQHRMPNRAKGQQAGQKKDGRDAQGPQDRNKIQHKRQSAPEDGIGKADETGSKCGRDADG